MEAFLSPELKGDLVSGILNLHDFDTELLYEAAETNTPDFLESISPPVPVLGQSLEAGLDQTPYVAKSLSGRQYNQLDFNPSRSTSTERERCTRDPNNLPKIKVVVRKRPINKKELTRKEEDIIAVEEHGCSLTVHEPKLKVDLTAYVEKHEFVFDAVLDGDVSNDEVYQVTVEPIVPTIFERTKATCFAYGQTGSGKTYTMQPLPLKASQHILNLMHHPNYRNQGFQLWLSYFEIYGGKLFDLLNDRSKLFMREDGRQQVCIIGLKEFEVSDVDMVCEYIEKGNAARSTGSTGANEESSRSHAILQLSIKKRLDKNASRTGQLVGKLSFIDLAGSERGADTTDNDRQTRLEGAEINKSLLALKECIRALDNDQVHIPFRGSKLTEVLRDSFVGNSRTVMISCISPSSGSCEHTLNTLRYADRVKGLSKNSNWKKDSSALALLESNRELTLDPKQAYKQDSGQISAVTTDLAPDLTKVECRTELPPLCYMQDSSENAFKAEISRHFEDQEQENIVLLPAKPGNMRDGNYDRQFTITARGEIHDRKDLPKANYLHTSVAEIRMIQQSHHQVTSLLKEEESLVAAHCKEVEETIEIVHEEMRLLGEIDKAGGRIEKYVTELSLVLSKKAASLLALQTRLARFQRLLKDHHILTRHHHHHPACEQ